MPFTIVRQDIVKMNVDAIVNAANTDLKMGGGVCGAIFKAAGAKQLQADCDRAAPIKTGDAAITPGFDLPCKYVIHAAGPIYRHWNKEQNEAFLRSAYTRSLRLAAENGCESIAFPLISSGIYGYPKSEAFRVATEAIREFLETKDMNVYLAVFDREAFDISRELAGRIESYIDENYVDSRKFGLSRRLNERNRCDSFDDEICFSEAPPPMQYIGGAAAPAKGLDELVGNLDESFSTTLLRLIDAKGRTDVEVYKRANIDRKLFSKIRAGKGYMPGKRTALALAIALELNLDETDDLLERLGYTLSHSQKFDVIIEYFIVNGQYDIFSINEVLFSYDLPLLGGA